MASTGSGSARRPATGAREAGRDGPRRLGRDRDFVVFWAAQALSVAGDSFALVAIPLLVLHATGSVAAMGLLTAVTGAAALLSGVVAGVLVDRVDRRRLLIVCDLARLVLYGLVPAVWAFGPRVWLLFVVMPLAETIGVIFQVAYVTAVPSLVGADQITEANGRLYATYAVAGVAGPLLAGIVSGLFGASAAIAIDAASFAASALGLCLIRLRRPDAGSAPRTTARDRGRCRQEFAAGVRFLWRHPVLRSLTLLLSVFIFLTAGLTDVLIYRLKHDLGQSDGVVGALLAFAALGTAAGALLVAPLRRRVGFGPCWIGAQLLGGLAIAGLGVPGTVPALALLAMLQLCCLSIGGICSMSLRQQVTPDDLLGRVTAAFWTIHNVLGPAGAALLTWSAGSVGVTTVCLVTGGACTLNAVAAMFTPVRQRQPERAERAGQAARPGRNAAARAPKGAGQAA